MPRAHSARRSRSPKSNPSGSRPPPGRPSHPENGLRRSSPRPVTLEEGSQLMANINAPFGFRPVRRLDGAAWSSTHSTFKMQNNAGALNRGDVVKRLADGTVAVAAAGGAGTSLGIFVGCHYLLAALGYPIWTNYWP